MMYACLSVTCHLHFWQNVPGLLRATAVTRGRNGHNYAESTYPGEVIFCVGRSVKAYGFTHKAGPQEEHIVRGQKHEGNLHRQQFMKKTEVLFCTGLERFQKGC